MSGQRSLFGGEVIWRYALNRRSCKVTSRTSPPVAYVPWFAGPTRNFFHQRLDYLAEKSVVARMGTMAAVLSFSRHQNDYQF